MYMLFQGFVIQGLLERRFNSLGNLRIEKELEKRHRMELPEVDGRYSDYVAHAFTVYERAQGHFATMQPVRSVY